MKRYINKWAVLFLFFFSITSCDDILDVEVFSELSPEVSSETVIQSVLYNAYASARYPFFNGGIIRYFGAEMTTGVAWNEGGAVASRLNQLRSFTWASNHGDITAGWNISYQGIRDANILLDNVDESTPFGRQIAAEAKFIRAFLYSYLYDWFGPVPLRTSTIQERYLPRATSEQIWAQIETDLLEAAEVLPVVALEKGRANKGAAYGVLAKHYLNTKQWQKAADMTQTIIDMGIYDLLPDYRSVFTVANKGNRELLWVLPRTSSGASGNVGGGEYINAISFPTDYPLLPTQQVYAASTHYYDFFVNSFESGDNRADLFLRSYVNTSGQTRVLHGNNRSISMKFEFHPSDVGPAGSTDQPEVRFSDILLTRAEALNELQGPNQESIDLINRVRNRAGASSLQLASFASTEELRAAILREREWEFWSEAKLRQDYIRHDVFISRARERGVDAQPHHVRFPIPLAEVNSNPEIEQTEGY